MYFFPEFFFIELKQFEHRLYNDILSCSIFKVIIIYIDSGNVFLI